MVWQLPISLHEWLSPPGTRVHHLQDRICRRLPAHARQARSLSPWLPCHRHADQGLSPILTSYDVYPHPLLQASADKIIREVELFGPDFERYEEVQAELDQAAEEKDTEPAVPGDVPVVDKSKGKKGKIVAKSTGFTYQFQIMESIGVPRADIKKFADPLHWLTVFPPIAMVSLPIVFLSYFPCSCVTTPPGRPSRVWISYRLASYFPHHRGQPVLRCLCPLAGQQAPSTRQNQIR